MRTFCHFVRRAHLQNHPSWFGSWFGFLYYFLFFISKLLAQEILSIACDFLIKKLWNMLPFKGIIHLFVLNNKMAQIITLKYTLLPDTWQQFTYIITIFVGDVWLESWIYSANNLLLFQLECEVCIIYVYFKFVQNHNRFSFLSDGPCLFQSPVTFKLIWITCWCKSAHFDYYDSSGFTKCSFYFGSWGWIINILFDSVIYIMHTISIVLFYIWNS